MRSRMSQDAAPTSPRAIRNTRANWVVSESLRSTGPPRQDLPVPSKQFPRLSYELGPLARLADLLRQLGHVILDIGGLGAGPLRDHDLAERTHDLDEHLVELLAQRLEEGEYAMSGGHGEGESTRPDRQAASVLRMASTERSASA